MRNIEQKVKFFASQMNYMNDHINQNGQIKKSSAVIKHWHTFTNEDWSDLLFVIKGLDNEGSMYLNHWRLQDIDHLIQHLDNYSNHADNLLYPDIKITNSLSKKLTNFDSTTSVKTVTFRVMMSAREAYCVMQGIDLPNDDSSIGKLTPQPSVQLFE